jgi:glycerophosphoryl diester phosphodiesterase
VALGAHMLETDVRMSKDGVIVVAHDDGCQRLCGVDKLISQCTVDELPPFKQ